MKPVPGMAGLPKGADGFTGDNCVAELCGKIVFSSDR
jgi:hypothetical protein